MTERTTMGRRAVLKRLGALGLVVPIGGALAACRDEDRAATTGSSARASATADPMDHGAPLVGTAASAQAQAPVTLDFMPNPVVPAPIDRTSPTDVKIELEAVDVKARLADGVGYTFWTFGGSVPGPMLRVRQDDTVTLTLKNKLGNGAGHNIDLHAVTGPGGGAALTNVGIGESKSFKFKATHPGVYVYHCATAPIPLHISNGMYGLIVVEPAEGLAKVDREFYVCQGEVYTAGKTGDPGMQTFDIQALADERPTYVVFNGASGSIAGDRALKARVGERVRIWFGVGGPNLTSSFHVIGEIFDRAATWGSLTSFAEHVQTISVAPGGATMVEFGVEVPGTYTLVDHALSRAAKGGAGQLVVEGAAAPDIFAQA
ncbi:MAG: copper-containing nitrite reductase [Dehalococcoidia bacterium]